MKPPPTRRDKLDIIDRTLSDLRRLGVTEGETVEKLERDRAKLLAQTFDARAWDVC
jgi:hypothetical protein